MGVSPSDSSRCRWQTRKSTLRLTPIIHHSILLGDRLATFLRPEFSDRIAPIFAESKRQLRAGAIQPGLHRTDVNADFLSQASRATGSARERGRPDGSTSPECRRRTRSCDLPEKRYTFCTIRLCRLIRSCAVSTSSCPVIPMYEDRYGRRRALPEPRKRAGGASGCPSHL